MNAVPHSFLSAFLPSVAKKAPPVRAEMNWGEGAGRR